MGGRTRTIVAFGAFAAALLMFGNAQAAEPVKPGDKVTINFTCRLNNGQLVATTEKSLTEDTNAVKSTIFVPRGTYEPLAITAVAEQARAGKRGETGLEDEIIAHIASFVVGMRAGQNSDMLLQVPAYSEDREATVIDVARVRFRPKQLRMTIEEYLKNARKKPELGQAYFVDPAIPCEVVSLSEDEVVVKCYSRTGMRVETAFGEGIVTETDRNFEIQINAEVGRLVRTGGYVGRIVKVDDPIITIDYSHPFGYEALKCEVKVEEAESSKLKAERK